MEPSLLEEYNPLTGPTDQLNALTDQFIGIITLVTIVSIVLTVIVLTLWIIGWVQKMKMHRAILDIQRTLAEMNEREKARFQKPTLHETQPPSTEEPARTTS